MAPHNEEDPVKAEAHTMPSLDFGDEIDAEVENSLVRRLDFIVLPTLGTVF